MTAAAVESTDEHLVCLARSGSSAAFEALIRRYHGRIVAYVRGIVSDHAVADDIVQDVLISAYRSLLASDREIAFRPWVYEIAKNACIDQLRRARRASEVSIHSEDFGDRDEARLAAAVGSIHAEVSRRQKLESLKMAFNELPQRHHDILVMRELEGLSCDKIGSRIGLSRSAVQSMLFRARKRLKAEFDDISTGERCTRVQAAMADVSSSRIGPREQRQLSGHLRDCAACRREAARRRTRELGRRRLGFDRADQRLVTLSRASKTIRSS
jgi:RNA polymerase sigma factor (sigma-70 family)